jgi:hypothetical protein
MKFRSQFNRRSLRPSVRRGSPPQLPYTKLFTINTNPRSMLVCETAVKWPILLFPRCFSQLDETNSINNLMLKQIKSAPVGGVIRSRHQPPSPRSPVCGRHITRGFVPWQCRGPLVSSCGSHPRGRLYKGQARELSRSPPFS